MTATVTVTQTRTPTRTSTGTRTPTTTRTPTFTASITPTFATIGAEISYFGVADANGQIDSPVGTAADGTRIFERPLPQGFFVVIEAKPGSSRRPVGSQTFNWSPSDPNLLPDLQLVSSRALGNGSAAVCDDGTPPNLGGVPAVDPPQFGGTQSSANAINDLSCRFDARKTASDACTRNQFQTESFVDPTTTVQFCPRVSIGAEIAFPLGDTRLTVRARDSLGQPGHPASIIVRVTP